MFYATKITRLLNGQILPQLMCGLAGDLASFELEEDFRPRCYTAGNNCRGRFQVSICLKRSALRLFIVHTEKNCTHA